MVQKHKQSSVLIWQHNHENCIGICIGIDGAQVLCELLKKNTTLTILNLDSKDMLLRNLKSAWYKRMNTDNWIGAKGTIPLSSMLLQNTTLVELSLCG